jgi:hypothetical protein
MPKVSLVVCVYNQFTLLQRLLSETERCYDDLVVIHDGPARAEPDDPTSIERLVEDSGGRFFVGPRSFQQEPHWSFAWAKAKYDWVLRLDADEIPSVELKNWLQHFRNAIEPDNTVSGYTCLWPLWNGKRAVTKHWPSDRIFLFHKERVRFFGMVEQVPLADDHFETLSLILRHQPQRKSYGFGNLLWRKQAYQWRHVIAQSLLGKPTDLACWRWTREEWPLVWEQIRRQPLRTGLRRLLGWPLRTAGHMKRTEGRVILSAVLSSGIHHCLIALNYWGMRRSISKV